MAPEQPFYVESKGPDFSAPFAFSTKLVALKAAIQLAESGTAGFWIKVWDCTESPVGTLILDLQRSRDYK